MKVLTLYQPWASLVARGVKTIETRSWSTKYRGPLAIHAGAKYPNFDAASILWPHGVERVFEMHASQGCEEGLPRGVIVATCTLVDVVPSGSIVWDRHEHEPYMGSQPIGRSIPGRYLYVSESQRPYGDFAIGRYAYVLADVVPVDPPMPFKGGQGLSRAWEPEVAA